MMRLLVVASILAIGSAAADENSIFSSRYLNSLEQANNADNTPSSSSFHHASSSSLMMDEMVGEYESSRQADELDSLSSHEHQRRELSWWSIALQFGEFSCLRFRGLLYVVHLTKLTYRHLVFNLVILLLLSS